MGWFFSLALIVAYIVKNDDAVIIAAGLFAIAGAIGACTVALKENGKYIKIPVNKK